MKCKNTVKFNNRSGFQPCGQCMNCRINTQREWATRLILEYKARGNRGLFITLTYDPEHLPESEKYPTGNLQKSALQKFIKRFRFNYGTGKRLSYYGVGEYGGRTGRAHYHVLIFGADPFIAEKLVKKSWTLGMSQITDLSQNTLNRIKYTLGYTLKKMTSEKDYPNGEQPEFALMSKNPAIGLSCLKRYKNYLIKNKKYPERGLNNYQKWYFESYYPELTPWKGDFKMDKNNMILDNYLSIKLVQMVYLEELNACEQHLIKSDGVNDEQYLLFLDRKQSENKLDKSITYTSPEHQKTIIKGEKAERKYNNNQVMNNL